MNPPQYTSACDPPPCYSIAVGGEITPTPSLDDHLALESVISALADDVTNDLSQTAAATAFVTSRRRHCSAQDAQSRRGDRRRRHVSAQDRLRLWSRSDDHPDRTGSDGSGEFRQRCFSFSALKDAFRRSHDADMLLPERESLLTGSDAGDDDIDDLNGTVFASSAGGSAADDDVMPCATAGLTVGASGSKTNVEKGNNNRSSNLAKLSSTRSRPQQVQFQVQILEDVEDLSSNDSLGGGGSSLSRTLRGAEQRLLRQRHSSAPDRVKALPSKSRRFSGNP